MGSSAELNCGNVCFSQTPLACEKSVLSFKIIQGPLHISQGVPITEETRLTQSLLTMPHSCHSDEDIPFYCLHISIQSEGKVLPLFDISDAVKYQV